MIWTIPNEAAPAALRDDGTQPSAGPDLGIAQAEPAEHTSGASARRSVRPSVTETGLSGGALRGGGGAMMASGPGAEGLVWSLSLAAADAQGTGRAVLLGLADAAAATLDPLDRLAAPSPPGEFLRLACRNEKMPLRSRDMDRDVRPTDWEAEGGDCWLLALSCVEPGPVQVSLSPRGQLPAGARARLVDPVSGRTVDLETAALYDFLAAPSGLTRELLVLVGSERYVESETQGAGSRDLAFALGPLSPNPARSSPYLEFTLPAEARTQLRIYDVSGRLVASLVEEVLPAGRHVVPWDRRAQSGRSVASGVYYVHLTAGARSQVGKLVVIR